MEFYTRDKNHRAGAVLETIEVPLWWQKQGLMYTATGYGNKIPTAYKVRHEGRLKRVYCRIFSNSGTLYIMSKGEKITVDVN